MPALFSLIALLGGSSVLLIGNGLQGLLIPIRAGLEGFSVGMIGLIAAAYSAGFVCGCVINPAVIRRVGHIRSFSVFAAVAAAIVLCHSLVFDQAVWFGLRLLNGICFSGLFMVIESWLNESANKETRGQIFGTYMLTNLASITAGMLLLILGDPADFQLFAITAIAILLALVPVSLTTTKAPTPVAQARLRPLRLLALSPVGVVGCFGVGLANGAFGGMAPIFAGSAGMSSTGVALFGAAAVIGGALGQYPIGRLSDRVDRRAVMVGACFVALLAELLLVAVVQGWVGAGLEPAGRRLVYILLAGVLGLFMYPIYGVSVAHCNDFVGDLNFIEVSSGLLLTWGIGASIGPIAAAQLMDLGGPAMLFVWLALTHLVIGGFALFRMSQRSAALQADKAAYSPTQSQRVTPTAYGLHPYSDGLPEGTDDGLEEASGERAAEEDKSGI